VARSVLDKMTVRAPIDGTVLQVNVRVGEVVSPGSPQPPLQLADLSALCVRAELDERDLGSVRSGQAVTVRAAAFPDREFEGSVSVDRAWSSRPPRAAGIAQPGRTGCRPGHGRIDGSGRAHDRHEGRRLFPFGQDREPVKTFRRQAPRNLAR
jgi:hypothetical protein